MARPPHNELAAAALLAAAAQQFPTLPSVFPDWLNPAEHETAVAWATRLAAGGAANPVSTPRQRATIFSQLFPDAQRSPAAERFIPLKPLALAEDALLPQLPDPDPAAAVADLGGQLQAALAALRGLTEPAAYLRGAYDALQRLAWCLPDVYAAGETAVSLFDHSRVAAALAPCYESATEAETAVLISGDISGVQDFIYTLTARGAASGLRGRSLYLQLLTEAIAQFVLNELQMPPTSLIYAGGGHFFLVAPTAVAGALPVIQRRVSEILLTHHQGALYLALGSARLAAADFAPGRFGAAWQLLSQDTSRAKRQRFSELSQKALLEELFTPRGAGGGKELECRVCHTEVADASLLIEVEGRADETGFPIYKCPLCASLEDLGENLRAAEGLLVTAVGAEENGYGRWSDTLHALGFDVRTIQAGAALPALAKGHSQPRLLVINDAAYTRWQAQAGGQMPVLRHFLVNVTPHVTAEDVRTFRQDHPQALAADVPRVDNVKPFDLLQQQARGIKRLGVLRMDVDDLGRIFAEGFGRGSSLVLTAALSSAMSLFFEGWVAELAAQVDGGRHVVYSIYSGGDDLFIVAAWDVLPALAHRIAESLGRYAAGNPHVHVSGGITLHGGKFPLYQAARAAEAALDQAKEHTGPAGSKNALTFLGRTLAWVDFPIVQAEFDRLVGLVQPPGGAPRSLLQQLMRLDLLYHKHEAQQLKAGKARSGTVFWGPWHWLSAYQLTRMAQQRERRQRELAQAILAIRDSLSGTNFGHIKQLGLSARWAELYLRENAGNRREEVSHE